MRTISIHYRRLSGREQVFRQLLLHEADDYLVTYLPGAELSGPIEVEGRTVLEPGAPIVWFTYPGRWYDIGRFHLADGSFTGIYANLLTPVDFAGDLWRTTDLCLDVWLDREGTVRILDEAELDEAERRGWVDAPTAERVRREADALAASAHRGGWPPGHVDRWTLERARQRIAGR